MALSYKGGLSRYRRYLQLLQEKPLWGASLYVVLTLILILTMLVFALRPTLITISGLLGQTKKLQETSDRMNHKIAEVQKAAEALDLARDRMGLLDEALPAKPLWSEWVTRIEDLALETGVGVEDLVLKSVQVTSETATSSATVEVEFVVSGVGRYEQLREFVKRVENNRRIPVLIETNLLTVREGVLGLNLKGHISYAP